MGMVWRKAVTPVALLLLLAILGFGMWWGWRELTRPFSSEQSQPCVTTEATTIDTTQVKVQVFNGGTAAGRAGQITQQLADAGFQTLNASNAGEDPGQTTIIGGKADDPAVQLVAGFFVDAITKSDGRVDGVVQVIVGDNYGGFNVEAPTTIDVPGGTVCLPGVETPTPTEGETTGG